MCYHICEALQAHLGKKPYMCAAWGQDGEDDVEGDDSARPNRAQK